MYKIKYILLAACVIVLAACTDTKKQGKDAMNRVIALHDQAMNKDGELMKNKIILDSLAKTGNAQLQKPAMAMASTLSAADVAMEDWMHQFNPDFTGKSHNDIMQYLDVQHNKIKQVNQQLNTAVNQSNQFIKQAK